MTLVPGVEGYLCQELAYPWRVSSEEPSTTELLAAALVVAFPQFVEAKLAALGVEPEGEVLHAAESGCTTLGHALHELIATALPLQGESPLQLVRIATQPLSAALAAAGVYPPERDAQAVEIHPEDVYDLYPASSRELGEEVWQLHMQWGLEKARVVAGMVPAKAPQDGTQPSVGLPAVALFGVNGEWRTAAAPTLAGLGYEMLVWRNPAALDAGLKRRPNLVLVDLDHPTAHDAIRASVAAQVRVIAVGSTINDLVADGLMALGAESVVDRDRLVERLPGLLPRLV